MSNAEWEALKAMVSSGFGKKGGASSAAGGSSTSNTSSFGSKKTFEEPARKEVVKPPAKPSPPPKEEDDDDDDDEEVIGPMPGGSAKNGNGARASSEEDDQEDMPGPPAPPRNLPTADEDEYEDEEDDSEAEEEVGFDSSALPITDQALLRGHSKPITALALDPSGNRLLTGSSDYAVKFWDFQGMDSGLRSFRHIEPTEGCQIRDLTWSISGDSFLVATTSAQPKLYDREGQVIQEFAKGDQYLSDMRNTKGHISSLSAVRFHPLDKSVFLTAAADSTIRLWNVDNKWKQKDVIVLKSKARGQMGGGPGGLRTAVTAASYSHDGKWIAAAAQDGALRIFASGGPYINPTQLVEGAHMTNSECGGLTWSLDNRTLLTRATDDTVKLWDIRNFKQPLLVKRDMPALAAETNAVFSPDEKVVVTGLASRKEGPGKLVFLRREDFSVIKEIDAVSQGSAIKVLWNPKINQIIVGGADANTRVFYDDKISFRGVKLAVGKAAKKRAIDDIEYQGPIITPELEKDAQIAAKRRKRQEQLSGGSKANHRPEAPLTGQGKGGKVGVSLSEILYRSVVPKNEKAFEDAREAILKHAEEAEKNPQFLAKAYEKTQPKPVFDERALEDEALYGREIKRRGMILKPSDIDKDSSKGGGSSK